MAPTDSVLSDCLGYQCMLRCGYTEAQLHGHRGLLWPANQVPAVVLSSMREEQTTQNEEIQIKSIKQTVKSCI